MTKKSNDFMLGKLDAMAQENQKFQVECISTLREIRDNFVDHTKEDAEKFDEIHAVIADAKGRIAGGKTVISFLVAAITFVVTVLGAFFARAMGW